jgi:hypothetical protein
MAGGATGGRPSAAGAAQARRLAAHREALLRSGTYTVAELSALRGEDLATTRLWLAQQLGDRSLFVVLHGEDQLVPAVLLTEAGQPRPELRPLLEVLADAGGLGGWSIWTWLTAHSPLLSGERAVDVAASDPHRARSAAERFAWPHSGA